MSPPKTADPSRSIDRSLSILANGHRRAILRALAKGRPIDRSGLDRIRDRSGATEPSFETRLHHVHLPLMAAEGVVEFDLDPLRIRRGPRFESVAPVVDALSPFDRTD